MEIGLIWWSFQRIIKNTETKLNKVVHRGDFVTKMIVTLAELVDVYHE